MRSSSVFIALFTITSGAVGLSACGSPLTSLFDEDDVGQDDDGDPMPALSGEGESDPSPAGEVLGDGGLAGDGEACASRDMSVARVPVRLVVGFDQSGSMGLVPYGNKAEKWTPVTTAFAGFLGDPLSENIAASMRLFPAVADDPTLNCSAASYASPEVPMTALPNAAAFTSKLPDTPPGLQTPTKAILQALVASAVEEKKNHPKDAVAVVLVTDGDPIGCGPAENDITVVAAAASAGSAQGIRTYAIGVGNVPNLDIIAAAGGTSKAYEVQIASPQSTQQQFLAAMAAIKNAQVSCEMTIPPPPVGQKLALASATLLYTPSTGPVVLPPYDPTCASGGYRFDDPSKPTKVVLCPALCDLLKMDPKAKVDLKVPCLAPPALPPADLPH